MIPLLFSQPEFLETKQVSTDKGLIKYLMRHWHSTPFEMCEIKYHIKSTFIADGLDTVQLMSMNTLRDIQF